MAADIELACKGRSANARSMIALLALDASEGASIRIRVTAREGVPNAKAVEQAVLRRAEQALGLAAF